jgi:hypothetical protein
LNTVIHENLALLVVSETQALEEIRAIVSLDDYIIGKVSDTEWVIDPARVAELQAKLGERGLSILRRKAHAEIDLP